MQILCTPLRAYTETCTHTRVNSVWIHAKICTYIYKFYVYIRNHIHTHMWTTTPHSHGYTNPPDLDGFKHNQQPLPGAVMQKCRMTNTKLRLSKIVTTFPVFDEHWDPNAVITMADDQGGTLDVKLLELLCFTRTRYKNKVTRILNMENDGSAKRIGKGCRPIWSKRNKQTARRALAWGAGTLCCSSRAAAAVLFICSIFQKKPLLLLCFSFYLLCHGEFWRSFFICFRLECIFFRCFRDNWDQTFLYFCRAKEHAGHSFVDLAQRTFWKELIQPHNHQPLTAQIPSCPSKDFFFPHCNQRWGHFGTLWWQYMKIV